MTYIIIYKISPASSPILTSGTRPHWSSIRTRPATYRLGSVYTVESRLNPQTLPKVSCIGMREIVRIASNVCSWYLTLMQPRDSFRHAGNFIALFRRLVSQDQEITYCLHRLLCQHYHTVHYLLCSSPCQSQLFIQHRSLQPHDLVHLLLQRRLLISPYKTVSPSTHSYCLSTLFFGHLVPRTSHNDATLSNLSLYSTAPGQMLNFGNDLSPCLLSKQQACAPSGVLHNLSG